MPRGLPCNVSVVDFWLTWNCWQVAHLTKRCLSAYEAGRHNGSGRPADPIGRITRVDSSSNTAGRRRAHQRGFPSTTTTTISPSSAQPSSQHVALNACWRCGLRASKPATGALQAIRSGSWAAAGADTIQTRQLTRPPSSIRHEIRITLAQLGQARLKRCADWVDIRTKLELGIISSCAGLPLAVSHEPGYGQGRRAVLCGQPVVVRGTCARRLRPVGAAYIPPELSACADARSISTRHEPDRGGLGS